jgi:hypothetical protein
MNTAEHGYPDSLAGGILGAVFEVSNTLGAGFLEKVYERGMEVCLLINFQKPSVDWKSIVYSPLSVCNSGTP